MHAIEKGTSCVTIGYGLLRYTIFVLTGPVVGRKKRYGFDNDDYYSFYLFLNVHCGFECHFQWLIYISLDVYYILRF